jgi:uncharacterized cupin superfamily protein
MRDAARLVDEANASFTPYTLSDGTPAGEIALLRQRNTENQTLFVGIYRCPQPIEGANEPYHHNDSFFVLSGELAVTLEDGSEHVFRAGDMGTVAKGQTAVGFRQSADFKKFFVMSE